MIPSLNKILEDVRKSHKGWPTFNARNPPHPLNVNLVFRSIYYFQCSPKVFRCALYFLTSFVIETRVLAQPTTFIGCVMDNFRGKDVALNTLHLLDCLMVEDQDPRAIAFPDAASKFSRYPIDIAARRQCVPQVFLLAVAGATIDERIYHRYGWFALVEGKASNRVFCSGVRKPSPFSGAAHVQ